jgi:hypothetical protein
MVGTILTVILAIALIVSWRLGEKANDAALQRKADQRALENVTRRRE